MAADALLVASPNAISTAPGVFRLFQKHPLARAGTLMIALLAVLAIGASHVSHGDPGQIFQDGGNTLKLLPPSPRFPLGTNTLGQDVWTRLVFGARASLAVALCAMVTSTLIGTTVGLIGGYFGGRTDVILTRITEIVTSLPTILLAITLAIMLPQRIWLFGHSHDIEFERLLLSIALVTWTGIARAVRGQTLSLKHREFVEAARAMGCSNPTILTRHLLPNVLPIVIALATLAVANNILLEAGLSYLGLGQDPAAPSWGGLIAEGQPYLTSAPWIALAAGAAIVLAVTAFNFVGTALQEVLEPRR